MIKNVHRTGNRQAPAAIAPFDCHTADLVINYHQSFPEYAVTPLQNLQALAASLGVKGVFLKDESYRFGLNAFKVLGGSFAIGRYIAEAIAMPVEQMTMAGLLAEDVIRKFGKQTFITTTDGNHGRGIAWTAARLGQHAVVNMPQGTADERLNNILALGAEATILDMNYDDAVRYSNALAIKNGWIMVQDTAWEGYEAIPLTIMQGYLTMVYETVRQLPVKPTHVFIQAGVGSVAGTVQALLKNYYGEACPIVTIVEADKAACLYETALAADGTLHNVGGDLATMMAGLACGEPNSLAWKILDAYADNFAKCSDEVAAQGMRILANPLGDDPKVVSGESGAVGIGMLSELMRSAKYVDIKNTLQLDEDSVVLCFSTEGATDKENYQRVIWDGIPSRCKL